MKIFNGTRKRSATAIILLGSAAGLLIGLREPLQSFWHWVADKEAITASMAQLGLWGPVALFLLLVAQVFIALIPGHALIAAGGYIYGFWPSLLITTGSTMLGSVVAFWAARHWGRELVYQLADGDTIARWDRIANRQGALFYFFTFVLPIFPADLMTYVAGLGTISPKSFLAACLSGRLICAIFITLLGANSFHLPPAFWTASLTALGALSLAWLAYAHKNGIRIRTLTCKENEG